MSRKEVFCLHLAPFCFHVTTDIPLVVENAKKMYGDRMGAPQANTDYIDYRISVMSSGGLRRFYQPQARFFCDQYEPFKPLSISQAYALLEWGMNWVVAGHELQQVVIHSGILAQNDQAVLFPAPPGSGKSTLTAFLANNGWRLLSDEMALVKAKSLTALPFVRPICLKNASINIAQQWFPNNAFSSIAKHTHKGDVIHMAPQIGCRDDYARPAQIKAIVFPNYRPNTDLDIYALNQRQAFMQLADNAFNFTTIGESAFASLTNIVESVPCYDVYYNDVAAVQAFIEQDILSDQS